MSVLDIITYASLFVASIANVVAAVYLIRTAQILKRIGAL